MNRFGDEVIINSKVFFLLHEKISRNSDDFDASSEDAEEQTEEDSSDVRLGKQAKLPFEKKIDHVLQRDVSTFPLFFPLSSSFCDCFYCLVFEKLLRRPS